MSLEELVSTFGYAAIVIGTFLEGETILILGGFAAHRGYLDLPLVIASAFAGTVFGDQLYFHLGRTKGQDALKKRPHWQAKSARVLSLLERHQTLLIFGFRFFYGFRTITPFILGVSRVSPLRFTALNLLGALAWSVVIGVLGYLFGQTLDILIGNIRRFEIWVFIALAALGMCIWLIHSLRQRR
jgi:membrane protein DedA with SNARE-associated domain